MFVVWVVFLFRGPWPRGIRPVKARPDHCDCLFGVGFIVMCCSLISLYISLPRGIRLLKARPDHRCALTTYCSGRGSLWKDAVDTVCPF